MVSMASWSISRATSWDCDRSKRSGLSAPTSVVSSRRSASCVVCTDVADAVLVVSFALHAVRETTVTPATMPVMIFVRQVKRCMGVLSYVMFGYET